jgi:hypothetical protein
MVPTRTEADQRAEHQRFALAEIEGAGGGERELVAERDDGIDHAERDAAEDQLQKDFHDFTYAARQQENGQP